jgi:hypothetical protein
MRILIFLLLLASSLTAQAPKATSPDPSDFGPLDVSLSVYRIDARLVPGVPYPVDIWANLWFPANLPGGPYPLVIFLHGNHGVCRRPGTQVDVGVINPPACPAGFEQTPNHAGYDYVASRLASHGYIVASINANAVNVRANGNSERGRLLQEHLRYWRLWNSAAGAYPFGRQFSGKVNLDNIGLFGHSRGGEGVRAAYNFNRQERAPFGLKAILELGPVDFGRNNNAAFPNPRFDVDNVPFSVLLPACDGDVLDNQGMRPYDRARILPEAQNPSPKSQIYIIGANHNFSNSEWTPEDPGFRCIDLPIITQRAVQENISAVYIMGFFRHYVGGENFKGLFTGDLNPPASVTLPIQTAYTESPERILTIANFTGTGEAIGANTAGGAVASTNAIVSRCAGASCSTPPPNDWVHDADVSAARIAWPESSASGAATPSFRIDVAADSAPRDVSRFGMLSFRAAVKFDSRNSIVDGSRFSVILRDSAGNTRAVRTQDYTPLPYPLGYFYRRAVLKTVRIPLADFRGVDLTKVTQIELRFDQAAAGHIYLTDVHFTN